MRFTEKNGQGVLVTGGFIVTAAHVLQWDLDGGIALGAEGYSQKIEMHGQSLLVEPLAIEPVAGSAVCGAVDSQISPEMARRFENLCEETPLLELHTRELRHGKPIPAYALAHTGQWIAGQVSQWRPHAQSLTFETLAEIHGGASGGPIVTEDGLLLGVMSAAGGSLDSPARFCTAPTALEPSCLDCQANVEARKGDLMGQKSKETFERVTDRRGKKRWWGNGVLLEQGGREAF